MIRSSTLFLLFLPALACRSDKSARSETGLVDDEVVIPDADGDGYDESELT